MYGVERNARAWAQLFSVSPHPLLMPGMCFLGLWSKALLQTHALEVKNASKDTGPFLVFDRDVRHRVWICLFLSISAHATLNPSAPFLPI